jgi:protein SCO1/2
MWKMRAIPPAKQVRRKAPLGILLLLLLEACQPQRRYPIRGVILAVDLPQHEISLKHEDIPGFMPAMTMVFRVEDDSALKTLVVGEQIHAELVIEGYSSRLEKISPASN